MLSRLSAATIAALAAFTAFAFAPAALLPKAHANPADVTVGMLRSPVNRAGAPLRAEPKMGANILGQVPHAARLTVQSVENGWLKVTTEVSAADGRKSTQTGWVRAVETVQPSSCNMRLAVVRTESSSSTSRMWPGRRGTADGSTSSSGSGSSSMSGKCSRKVVPTPTALP